MAYIVYSDKDRKKLNKLAEEYDTDPYELERAHEEMLNANLVQDLKGLVNVLASSD